MTTRYQPGARISEYVLETCLGAGTFGEVWQARHHVWSTEHVAVKLPTEPEYVRYLQREGVVVHGLRHPNIVRVLGMDPYADVPYLVMELVRGPSLRKLIDEHAKGLPVEVVVTILRGLLRGLDVAHCANIVHRDMKPGNILLDLADGSLEALTVDGVKIVDFGLGASSGEALRSIIVQSASLEQSAQDVALAGTLAYMAPEVRDGQEPPAPTSDLFALGVVLYEMLTGERPAGAELPSTIRPDTPTMLDEVFRRLYARRDRRYESAAAALTDLNARRGVPTPPVRTLPPIPTPPTPGSIPQLTKTCTACNSVVGADDQFCTQCGTQLVSTVRRCASCGGYPGPRDHFCVLCGALVPFEGEE